MLYIFCALACEAKPFIDAYSLKKEASHTLFPLYSNADGIYLIVSGIGSLSSAAACTYLAAAYPIESPVILNAGCAGHGSLPIGTAAVASKVTHESSERCYYPTFLKKPPFIQKTIKTVSHPNSCYPEDFLYEMEAHGFYQFASRLSCAELVHCWKVISDNASFPLDTIDPVSVSRAIDQHMDSLHLWIQYLLSLRTSIVSSPSSLHSSFLEKAHFTETERQQLSSLLSKAKACSLTLDKNHPIWALSKAREILRDLEQAINAQPLLF